MALFGHAHPLKSKTSFNIAQNFSQATLPVDNFKFQCDSGWGDPLDRDSDDVARDFKNGLVTEDHARDAYGVIIDVKNGETDTTGTNRQMEKMRTGRLNNVSV